MPGLWSLSFLPQAFWQPSSSDSLEDHLASELKAAPSDSIRDDVAREGVATIVVELQASELGDPGSAVSCVVHSLDGNSKPLMVEHIERLRLELQRQPLAYLDVFEYGKIGGADRLASFGISAQGREGRSENFLCLKVVDYEMSS